MRRSFAIVVCLMLLWPSVAAADSIRSAALMFAPLPVPSLFSPSVAEHLAQLELDDRWPMPTRDVMEWPNFDGEPFIETRSMDELWHTVLPHQNSKRLLDMYKGGLHRLRKMNPGVSFGRLTPGELLLVWKRNPKKYSIAYGAPAAGFLRYSEPLPQGDAYKILYPHRTFGTYYAVSEVVRVMDGYTARFPDADQLLVGDISFRAGGKMTPHASHRTGRDIDISYPRVDETDFRRFQNVNGKTMDSEKTLWMLKSFLDTDQVDMMFVDRRLQRELVREAKRQGAPKAWINAVFQYPNFSGGTAVIRHSRGHVNHFHVRFKCQPTDSTCK